MFWKRLRRDRGAMLALVILAVLGLMALLAPWLAPYDPSEQALEARRAPPSAEHPFGRDLFGRDMLSRIIYGSRLSLFAGALSVALSASVGTLVGVVSGYFGGWIDTVISRFIDMLLSFPYFLLAILMAAVLGPGLTNACVAVAIATLPRVARLIRGSVLTVKDSEYIEAVRALGAGDARIIAVHILPNVAAPLIVMVTLELGGSIMRTSALSFLGLGAQPPASEWGLMLNEARGYIGTAPHMALIPGAFIAVIVLAFNLIGDGLRDVLDPRQK